VSGWRRIRDLTRTDYDRFRANLRRPHEAQSDQLRDIVSLHAGSEFGRRHGFDLVKDPDDFRARVSICAPEHFERDIRRMAVGEIGPLCARPIVTFEQTSGSHSGGRLVPYTAEGLAAFRRAVLPWLHDLIGSRPGIAGGRAYWTISPVGRPRNGEGATLGLSTDAQYFGPEVAPLIAGLSAAPMALAEVEDIDAWRYLVLRFLVEARDLTLISVWSPTFLTGLLDKMLRYADRLVADVAAGTVSWPGIASAACPARFEPDPERAREIAAAFSDIDPDMERVWPSLDTISCWAHGSSSRFVDEVADRLPRAWIQPKGLLATEAAVSIPLADFPWPVLAVDSGFYEFVDEDGNSFLCDEVETGGSYRVVVTTHSGLYRYELGDRVTIHGWAEATPMIEFVGRGGLVSDLCGEKLAEAFVHEVLGDEPGFAMVAPTTDAAGYALFLDASRWDERSATARARALEDRLTGNPHYAYARRLGQLAPLKAVRVLDPLSRYYEACLARGQRVGEIKPPVLRSETDWDSVLRGRGHVGTGLDAHRVTHRTEDCL
jgi:hypothetical protein